MPEDYLVLVGAFKSPPMPVPGSPVDLVGAQALHAWLLHPDTCHGGTLSARYVPAYLGALVDEVERLRAAGKKLVAELSSWQHSEDCQKDGHSDCGPDDREQEGWYCEQGDTQADCAARECECGRDKSQRLADELAGLAAPPHAGAQPAPGARLALDCPVCGVAHVDEGEWATREHKTHQCQACGHEWRPFEVPTFGASRAENGASNDR